MKKQLLLLAMILLPMVASAHDIEVQNADGVTIYYNYINDGTELEVTFRGNNEYSYDNEYTENVVIPEEVTYMGSTRKVTSIGESAFEDCSGLTSVTIPNCVTSIENYAFLYCLGLTSVNIPNSVTRIGDSAFEDCSGLTSVDIPNSVTTIECCAFEGCSGLTSITIGNSVMRIGNRAFSRCPELTSILVENGNTNYDSRNNCNAIIETSSNTLIAGCKNTTLLNSVTSIGREAFFGCSSLTSITIPNSVTSIGYGAFFGCSSLTSITIPNSVTSIGEGAFWVCSGLTSVTIPSSVLNIGDKAFNECTKLNSIISEIKKPYAIELKETIFSSETYSKATLIIPAFTKTSYQATEFWNKFTNIVEREPIERTIHMSTAGTLADKISEAEKYTIEKLVLTGEINGADLRLIRDMAGNNGKDTEGVLRFLDLSGVKLKEGPEPILNSIYVEWGPVNKYYPRSVCLNGTLFISDSHSLPGCTFVGCTSLVSVSLPDNLTSIEGHTFLGCGNLTYINIPSTVEYWGDDISSEAFTETNWYENQPDGVVYLGNILYKYKGTMPENTTINIKEGTKGIASDAFAVCTGLTSITIPNSVSTIGMCAFYECTNLKTITIPESVYRIGGSAFKNTAWYDEQPEGPIYAGNVLYDYKGDNAPININVKEGTLGIADYAFNGCKTIESINIPSSTKYIRITYGGGPSLQSINVDSNNGQYKSISGVLFSKDGSKLICYPSNKSESSYSIPSGVKFIMGDAFHDSDNLESVTTPKSVVAIDSRNFSYCSKLSSIKLQDGLRYISNFAFSNSTELTDVYCYAETVPNTNPNAFDYFNIENATLHVPTQSIDVYKAAEPWKNFKSIVEIQSVDPIEGETTVNTDNLNGQDLSDNVVDGVYYNVGEEGYDARDGSIVIGETTNMGQITDSEPGSDDVKNNFTGIILKVAAGKGTIKVNVKTSGNAQLVVQIGNGTPMIASKTEQGDVVVSYDVAEDTYVYIYAIIGSSASPSMRASSTDEVRIYGFTVSPEASSVKTVWASEDGNAQIFSLDGKPLNEPQKGVNIVRMSNGQVRKVVVK